MNSNDMNSDKFVKWYLKSTECLTPYLPHPTRSQSCAQVQPHNKYKQKTLTKFVSQFHPLSIVNHSRNTCRTDDDIQSRTLCLDRRRTRGSTPHQPQLVTRLIIRPNCIRINLQKVLIRRRRGRRKICRTVIQKLYIASKDALELLLVAITPSSFAWLVQNPIRVRQMIDPRERKRIS